MQKKALAIFFLGSLSWSLVMVRSGLIYSYGLGFWGPNGHDGIWHIALANSLLHFPWNMPTLAGEHLKNYHIGFDLILAILSKITFIPINNLYFQIFPPIIAILTGVLTYKFVNKWQKSKKAALWATFFVYFGGSLGWILSKGESTFWSQQAISTLINPPFALSLIFILLGLIYFKKPLLSILFFGLLIQIKSYAGLLVLGALLVTSVYEIIFNHKFKSLIIFISSLALSLLIFLPLNSGSSSLLVFNPFWFLETMMQLTDRVGWLRFGEAMVNYKYAHNFLKAIPAYSIAFAIFIIGNLGTRVLGFKYLFKKKLSQTDVFIYSATGAGILLPMLFLQKGTPWNTIQFFYYSLFFLSILAGITLSKLSLKFQIIIILLTIPTTLITLSQNYLTKNPPSYLPSEEFQALTFLSKEPYGTVLTYPFDQSLSLNAQAPKPLYLYVSTAYVSAYSQKQVFLEDEMNADITGFNWQSRRKEIENFYSSLDQNYVYNFLRDNNIKYIYWVKPQRATLGETQLGIQRIFENSKVDIYKVKN